MNSDVFPTCVGMARANWPQRRRGTCIPHLRGDGPNGGGCVAAWNAYSPPAWGWPGNVVHDQTTNGVFPTCVGMALSPNAI